MDQQIRRVELIKVLLEERPEYQGIGIPVSSKEQQRMLRSLMNIRLPGKISDEFTKIQDEYLAEAVRDKGITDIADLIPVKDGIYLWQGDITTLKCDAIVNAANSGMTGCYVPCHGCIDNCIHTYAGIQLRNCCAGIMEKQGHEEATGKAKITPGFNLPCKYVLHTVGPVITGDLTKNDEGLLASCYRSCLDPPNACKAIWLVLCYLLNNIFGQKNPRFMLKFIMSG